MAILGRDLLRGAERHAARQDRDAAQRLRLGRGPREQRVAGFVDRDALLLDVAQLALARIAEDDLVVRGREVIAA